MIDNLKITSQYPFCPYALSMDLYWGCPHGCTYCFAQQAFYANNSMNERSFTTERPMTWNTKNATNPAVFFKNLRPAIKDGAIAYEYVDEKSEPTPK